MDQSKRLSNINWAKGMLEEFGEFENLGKGRIWQEDFDRYFDRLREIYGDGPPDGFIEVQALKMVILLGDCKGEFGKDFNFDIVIDSEQGEDGPSKEIITISY